MPTARREHFGQLLEPGLREIFYDTFQNIPSVGDQLYNVQSTDEPNIEDLGIGAMGNFPRFTGSVQYDRPYQGFVKRYEFSEFADGFKIERKLWDDDRYNVINKRPAGLAIAAARRKEEDMALLFNNANAASAADADGVLVDLRGSDGVPLLSAVHPSAAVQQGGDGPAARSNIGNLPLTHANVVVTKNRMRSTLDDRGNRILVNPDTLLVPTELYETAWMINKAERVINSADVNPNINQSAWNIIEWPMLTSATAWFMIDSKFMKMFLNWYDRIPLEFGQEEDFDTFVAKFRAYMRYGAGFSDWLWIYGQTP